MTFAEKISFQVKASKTQLCLGLDIHPAQLSAELQKLVACHGPYQILSDICVTALEASVDKVGTVKFQSSFFEYYGDLGFKVLRESIAHARRLGYLTILDAKRGDIASTMEAYGYMAFEAMKADALTVLPYMGLSVLDSLKSWLAKGFGTYVVWVSSNPDGWSVQQTIYEQLLEQIGQWCRKTQLTDAVGLVLGATSCSQISESSFNAALSHPLLLPGFGAQGATMNDRIRRIRAESAASLFPVSRALLDSSVLNASDRAGLVGEVQTQLAGRLTTQCDFFKH